jgi:hypothetical protein
LFAGSAKHAARYGRIKLCALGGKPFHIVEVRVPKSFARSLYSDYADRMPYFDVPESLLSELNNPWRN